MCQSRSSLPSATRYTYASLIPAGEGSITIQDQAASKLLCRGVGYPWGRQPAVRNRQSSRQRTLVCCFVGQASTCYLQACPKPHILSHSLVTQHHGLSLRGVPPGTSPLATALSHIPMFRAHRLLEHSGITLFARTRSIWNPRHIPFESCKKKSGDQKMKLRAPS